MSIPVKLSAQENISRYLPLKVIKVVTRVITKNSVLPVISPVRIFFLDSTRYRHHIEMTGLIAERDHFKIQNDEIKKYSNNEIDLMKHEITQVRFKLAPSDWLLHNEH